MKKSNVITLLVFFLLIPATIFFGMKLPGKSYYVTGTLIILELMIPFFLAFEGRRPKARELVIIAVLCALAIVARVAIPIPHFKANFAVIILAGIAFGPEAGFMVGAISAFASNFLYGQGPYTPWQMMAYGAGGMVAGFLFRKNHLQMDRAIMDIFGFFCVVLWIGPLRDCSGIFLMLSHINLDSAIAVLLSGFPVNIANGISTALVLLLFGRPLLEKLDRIKIKYGMMGEE